MCPARQWIPDTQARDALLLIRRYAWLAPPDLPDGYLEVHAFTVDSAGYLYGGDTSRPHAECLPKKGAAPKQWSRAPWVKGADRRMLRLDGGGICIRES